MGRISVWPGVNFHLCPGSCGQMWKSFMHIQSFPHNSNRRKWNPRTPHNSSKMLINVSVSTMQGRAKLKTTQFKENGPKQLGIMHDTWTFVDHQRKPEYENKKKFPPSVTSLLESEFTIGRCAWTKKNSLSYFSVHLNIFIWLRWMRRVILKRWKKIRLDAALKARDLESVYFWWSWLLLLKAVEIALAYLYGVWLSGCWPGVYLRHEYVTQTTISS